SRLRPSWATARLAVYGDVSEVDRRDLAMNREESKRVLGSHPDFEHVVAQAEGWPAVIGLAATARGVRAPDPKLSSRLLHAYFTEELFKSASAQIQHGLLRIALAPDLEPATLKEFLGDDADALRAEAKELGFLSSETGSDEIHPLVRDFLFEKLRGTSD